ncbi:tetratricopeptide repeat protein [Flagellimonas marina]|uniref:Tetratricopeptide repeat protein n=1 Tax=Flagellimonas marina TaxID=1775168 RepID=A0ABV8PR29_9FLAO
MNGKFLFGVCMVVSALTYCPSYAQEEQESAEVYLEEYTDEFQENFFEALKQKGIQNYDRAIDLLLNCKQLDPSNSVVDYELAKAYALDKQHVLAQEYAVKALNAEPTDFWYLDNLLHVLDQGSIPFEAVKQDIPFDNQKLRQNLALGYFKMRKYDDALKVLNGLGSSKFVEELTSKINDSLQQKEEKKVISVAVKEKKESNHPTAQYRSQIEELFSKSDFNQALTVSKEALDSYPMQPYFYYAYGTALNNTEKPNKAIEVLESGLDYLLDDGQLANKMFGELSKAYTSIGNISKANEYLNKIKPGL